MIPNRFRFRILATVLFLGGCFTARGQSTFGSISGTVKDASGAAIAGAEVTLTSTATGANRHLLQIKTDSVFLSQLESR